MDKDVNDAKEPLFNRQSLHQKKQKSEANSATLHSRGEPVLSPNALAVLKKRYLAKDPQGNVIETPSQLLRRVASNIASSELKYNPEYDIKTLAEEFYNMMCRLEFLPNSPTLMNAGRELQQLSACFVLPVDDSMESIFDAVKNLAVIQKSGGGTGFSFSRLRPKNDKVATTGGVASGPISFMKVFNSATDVVKQGGTRRGANMAILEVTHPDILEFITVKSDMKELTNFNLSVAITEDFMKAVEEGVDYDLINPRNGKPAGKLNARKVFDTIVESAWRSGEPGIIFIDRINRDNPTPGIGRIESTNPCGEVPLLPMESCNLGSINLAKMLKSESGVVGIDYEKLARTVKLAVRFLDNVIDMNNYPLPQIEAMTMGNRKIGVGVMGFADMLIRMDVPYNSEKALKIAEEAMSFIQKKAREVSVELAREKGPFPNFIVSRFFNEGSPPLRNATLTTVAPTGTLSIIAGCSSGIEPIFALSYIRQILDEEKFLEVHPIFEEMAKEKGFYSKELMENLSKKASIQNVKSIPEDVRKNFVTSHDVSPEWHVRMQAAFQKSTDNAVSKTVNFPKEASREDVGKVFWLAHREGCKCIT
ncbi:MAG: vitamin B12-dependent ribonucleotide reductase, partial [Firmicutes bacterium]|nr:vitamin B12-dependent ribonucleotide reductase [Bacillota bacterium]